MAQVSRPFQIALGAVVVLALVWMMALRNHASNPIEPAPSSQSASAPASGATSKAKNPAAPTSVYHGAAPGVEGLTRAIAKAHGAVALSQQNAQQLQRKSGEASGESQVSTTAASHVAAAKGASGAAATRKSSVASALAHKRTSHTNGRAGSGSRAHNGRTAVQVRVERELTQGKTAMLLFWNPKSTVDQEVRAQAGAFAARSKGTVTLHVALARQMSMFGSITEVAHVYQTPTILFVNRHGLVSTLTGLTDVFALEQVVREARGASR